MNTVKEFISFTNLKNNRIKLSLLLMVASILYCIVLSLVHTIIYMGNPFYYYAALYIFVVWTAFIYMIILFQFLQKKRGIEKALSLKSYILPLVGVQTIFYVVMIGCGLLTFMVAGTTQYSSFYYILTPVCILLTICYIPVQVFSFFAIYDGVSNPFIIIKTAFMKLIKHYRSCFYALLTLVIFAMAYNIIMGAAFDLSQSFQAFNAVQNVMVQSNPFVNAVNYMVYAFQNGALWPAVVVSFLYGVVMCILLVYYYMFMVCIYDEDIQI